MSERVQTFQFLPKFTSFRRIFSARMCALFRCSVEFMQNDLRLQQNCTHKIGIIHECGKSKRKFFKLIKFRILLVLFIFQRIFEVVVDIFWQKIAREHIHWFLFIWLFELRGYERCELRLEQKNGHILIKKIWKRKSGDLKWQNKLE